METILNTNRFSTIEVLRLDFIDLNDWEVLKKKRNKRSLEIGGVHQMLDEEDFACELLRWESVSVSEGFDGNSTFGYDDAFDYVETEQPITSGQMAALFQHITEESKMKCLEISGYDLRNPDSEAFANCSKLEEIQLDLCELNSDQMAAFFKECAERTKLKKFYLGFALNFEHHGFHQLHHVDPTLFASGISNIEKVTLHSFGGAHRQMEELFKTISKESKIKEITLRQSWCLAGVDPDVLAIGLNKLEKVDISNLNLEKEQLEKIFQQILIKSNLKKLDIRFNSNFMNIDNYQKVLEAAKRKITTLLHT